MAPHALEELQGPAQIVYVWELDEFTEPLSHIVGATLIPLCSSHVRPGELARERPVVTVCRASSRSANQLTALEQTGIKNAANLAGGMLRWRTEGNCFGRERVAPEIVR